MKKVVAIVFALCLLMAGSCRHSTPASPDVRQIDNSKYELVNKQLNVTGVGESRNHQQAHSKSRAAALDSAVVFLRESITAIAEQRGLRPISVEEFQLANTHVIDQHTTAYNNEKNVRIYRSTQTLSIDIEPLLKVLYDNLGAGADYSWYMFLRDMDYQIESKNNKQ